MSDALENKAVEILDKSQHAIAVFSDKLVDLAKQYGPDVVDGALAVARVDAASNLVYGVVWLGLGAIGGMIAWRYISAQQTKYAAYTDALKKYDGEFSAWRDANGVGKPPKHPRDFMERPDGECVYFFGMIGGGASAIMGLIGIFLLADIWRWVGLFEPKLWLAKRVLGL